MNREMSAFGTKRTLHRDRAMSLLEVKQTSRGSASAGRTIKPRSLIALPRDPTIGMTQAQQSTKGERIAAMLTLTKPQQHALFRDFPSWVTPFRQNRITKWTGY